MYTYWVKSINWRITLYCSAQTHKWLTLPKITFYVTVPADNPIISGPTAATALDANKNYNHTCTAANGYPVVNIVWRLGTSFGTSQDLSQGVSGRTFRISESTTTNSDSTLTKVSVLSWTPITADNGNILFCVTTQLTAPGGSVPNITKSTNVLISVQRKQW